MSDMKLKITRDSVCIADDMQDHAKTVCIDLQHDIFTTIYNIGKEYLPTIAGRGHSWSCFLNDENIAIIDGNCTKITTLINNPNFPNESKLYFKYHSATA